jgi:hypothetical protein
MTIMKNITVISNARECIIEVSHRNSDSGVWIVGRWTRAMLLRKRVSSHWFIDRHQAFAFAHEMKREHDEEPRK